MDWQNFGSGWRRASYRIPGYDCRVECRHEHKGNHGICADHWYYVVSDGPCAVSLTVRSGIYPATVDTRMHEPEGTDLLLHVSWPAADDLENLEELIRKGDQSGCECDLVEGGRCWIPRSTLSFGAQEFWAAHGALAFEQPESFWDALRAKAVEWIGEARADRAAMPRLRQCSCCQGRGVVEDAEPKSKQEV